MKIRVLLFALARQLAGSPQLELDLPASATIAQVRAALGQKLPQLSAMLKSASFAVNAEYVRDDAVACESDEVALILPVSGG